MTREQLEALFTGRGIERGGELYLRKWDALEFLQVAEREGFAVIGIEVFRLSANETIPIPALAADFSRIAHVPSWGEFAARVNRESAAFVKSIPEDDLWVYAVAITPDEWLESNARG